MIGEESLEEKIFQKILNDKYILIIDNLPIKEARSLIKEFGYGCGMVRMGLIRFLHFRKGIRVPPIFHPSFREMLERAYGKEEYLCYFPMKQDLEKIFDEKERRRFKEVLEKLKENAQKIYSLEEFLATKGKSLKDFI